MAQHKRVTDGVIGVSAVALVVASFLDWFTATIDATNTVMMMPDGSIGDLGVGHIRVDGWGLDMWFLWTLPPVVVALAMLSVVVLRVFAPQGRLAQVSIDLGALGLLAASLVTIKLLIGEDIAERNMFEVTVDRSIGIYLALASALGLVVGGFLSPYSRTRRGAENDTTDSGA